MSSPAAFDDLLHALRTLLGDGVARDAAAIEGALRDAGLVEAAVQRDAITTVLESDLIGLVMPLLDGRHVDLPALLGDQIFTHRLSQRELEGDYLVATPDLEPLSLLTTEDRFAQLSDGSPLIETFAATHADLLTARGIDLATDLNADIDSPIWLLSPGTLSDFGFSAGDLVGVRVADGGFGLLTVPQEPMLDSALCTRLTSLLAVLSAGQPLPISDLVWQACADAPDLFATPTTPLGEMLDACDIAREGAVVAPSGFDFEVWRIESEAAHLMEVYDLDPDEAIAVMVFVDQVYERSAAPDALSRDMLTLLEVPAVAEALATETLGAGRDGAPALARFAEDVLPTAPRAARANLLWLHATALERSGLTLAAEEALESALGSDPTSVLALFDLARFASDRGDVERGLSLLRRAEATPEDPLVVLLEHFRVSERTDLGRNDPCWCGSGRKFKACHRNRETLALEDRAAWLYQKAGAYVADPTWHERAYHLATLRASGSTEPEATRQALNEPLTADALMFEGGVFEAFLNERGMLLPEDERLLADQWLASDRSLHQIETVTPGEGFTSRDLRSGDVVTVREAAASHTLIPGALVCGRLVSAGETVQSFGGLEPVSADRQDELLSLLSADPTAEDLVSFLSRASAAAGPGTSTR